jgi:hypothetical protein
LLGLPSASASSAPAHLLKETSVENQKIRNLSDTLRPFLVYIANRRAGACRKGLARENTRRK